MGSEMAKMAGIIPANDGSFDGMILDSDVGGT
jgi:hypothetical protein